MAELTGKVIAVLPLANGVSNRTGNEWVSQEYVIEEQDARYPQRVCFNVFGRDKIQQYALQLGEVVTVKLEFGAREYKGKWYNDINCWSVERPQAAQPVQPQVQQQPYNQPTPQPQQNYAPVGQYQQSVPQQQYAQQPQAPYPPQGQGGYQQPQQEDLPF